MSLTSLPLQEKAASKFQKANPNNKPTWSRHLVNYGCLVLLVLMMVTVAFQRLLALESNFIMFLALACVDHSEHGDTIINARL
eukprot:g15289.t1